MMLSDTNRSQHNQAILHTSDVSGRAGSGATTTDIKKDGDHGQYVKLNETELPDGTKMKFYARKDNAPTFDEIMKEVYDLASKALVRKLSK